MSRRKRGEPPAYKTHPTRGYAFVFIDGKQIYLGMHGSADAKERYREVVNLWERDHADEMTVPLNKSARCTVAEFVAAFMDHAKVYYRRDDGSPTAEYNDCKHALAALLAAKYAGMRVNDFQPAHLKEIREVWVKGGIARQTVNKQVGRVRRAFNWGVEERMIDQGVAGALGYIKGLQAGRCAAPDYEEVSPVPLRDLAKTLKIAPRHIAAMIRTQYYIGCRPAEVCRMSGCEINRQGIAKVGKRIINCGAGVWVFQPRRHKTKARGGKIYYLIGPRAQEILAPFLREDPEEFLFQPREAMQERREARRAVRVSKVQPSQEDRSTKYRKRPPGSVYTTSSYGKAIAKLAKKAGAEQWSPNQLRHAFLTRADRLVGIQAASLLVGHTRSSTTELYVERNLKGAGQFQAAHG